MKRRSQIRNAALCILVLIFAVLALAIGRVTRLDFSVIASLAVVFGLLGLVLIVPTARLAESRTRKTLFVLTGVSAAGIPISVILHNLFYGPFIAWFGEGFRGPGGDEPVFFVLAIFVCPALFLVSAVASGILLLKVRFAKNKNEPQQGVSGLRFSLSAKNIASTLASVVYKGV